MRVIAIFGVVAGGLVASLLLTSHAFADQTPAQRLSITPLETYITVPQGTSQTKSITIADTGSQALNIELSTEAFRVADYTYNYTFLPDSVINQWVHFSPSNVHLNSGQSTTISYTISVPLNADPGDKYLSLFAATTPGSTKGITSVERVGSLVYITVPGDITEKGSLLSLRSPFVALADTTWTAAIQNSGSIHFKSTYTVDLETLWNKKLTETTGSTTILSNSIRLVSDSLKMPQWIGIYKVHYAIGIGGNSVNQQTHLLIYAPISQVVGFGAILALLIIFIVTTIRRPKKVTTKPETEEEKTRSR